MANAVNFIAEERVQRIAQLLMDDDGFDCPHCGYRIELDCDVTPLVVTYWGEEPHPFTCSECDKDFLVKENVTRKFETFTDHEAME